MNDNLRIWQNNYNNQPVDYNTLSAGNRWQQYLIADILSCLPSNKVQTALDVGCGTGEKTALLAELFPNADVIGMDFSDIGILNAKQHRESEHLNFICADVTKGSYDNTEGGYTLVSCFQVLEHLDDWEAMCTTICKISTRYVLISVPTGRMRKYEVYEGHLRNFKRGQIESFMQEAGYRPLKIYYAGFPFYSPLERDAMGLLFRRHKQAVSEFQYSGMTKILHEVVFFLYRYLNSKTVGDQFLGLFEREEFV